MPILSTLSPSRGREARTPVYGFGDRRTTTVLFPCVCVSSPTKDIITQIPHSPQGIFSIYLQSLEQSLLFTACFLQKQLDFRE